MSQQSDRAVDAVWKTDCESSQEKLVLYHLASKHELGDRYASSWKTLETFLQDFELRWSPLKDIKLATQLTEVKLQRTLEALLKKGYIEGPKDAAEGASQGSFAITRKLFDEYRRVQKKTA